MQGLSFRPGGGPSPAMYDTVAISTLSRGGCNEGPLLSQDHSTSSLGEVEVGPSLCACPC